MQTIYLKSSEDIEASNTSLYPNVSSRRASSFIVAGLIFLLLNLTLAFLKPIKIDPYAFPYRNWIWWEVNDLRTSPSSYNVALLGSSLVISAINCCDAEYLQKRLDQIQYHGAAYLDHKLAQTFGGRFNTFNLASPGETPADAYLCLKTMVDCGKKPDIVIYGIAPRDFIDGTMNRVADGEPYRYLSRVMNYTDTDPQFAYHGAMNQLEYILQRQVYLFGNASDLQMMGGNLMSSLLDNAIPRPVYGKPFTWWDRVKFFPQYKAGDVYPGACMAVPQDPAHPQPFLDNTKDYQARYRSPRKWAYDAQVHFLRKLAAYCTHQHIDLFIVNMPITYYNTNMLRQGIYTSYVNAMTNLAASAHADFFDLCKFDLYPLPLYNDYVHLNGNGGKVFVDDLVTRLAETPSAEQALTRAGKTMTSDLAAGGPTQTANLPGK
jgi:hypothetical protein